MSEEDYKTFSGLLNLVSTMYQHEPRATEFNYMLNEIFDEVDRNPKVGRVAIAFLRHLENRLDQEFDLSIPFNRVTEARTDGEVFIVSNYDWGMFKWATTFNYSRYINNSYMAVPKREMPKTVVEKFQNKVKENIGEKA